MKTISEFLGDLEAHQIFDAAGLAQDFTQATGVEPCWPTHSLQETKAAIVDRGLGGSIPAAVAGPCAYGWEVAEALADKYGTHQAYRTKMGRGTRFNLALDSLQKAGK